MRVINSHEHYNIILHRVIKILTLSTILYQLFNKKQKQQSWHLTKFSFHIIGVLNFAINLARSFIVAKNY